MEYISEEKIALQDQMNTLNSQIDRLKSELLKEQSTVRETKVSIYQYSYLITTMSPAI